MTDLTFSVLSGSRALSRFHRPWKGGRTRISCGDGKPLKPRAIDRSIYSPSLTNILASGVNKAQARCDNGE